MHGLCMRTYVVHFSDQPLKPMQEIQMDAKTFSSQKIKHSSMKLFQCPLDADRYLTSINSLKLIT